MELSIEKGFLTGFHHRFLDIFSLQPCDLYSSGVLSPFPHPTPLASLEVWLELLIALPFGTINFFGIFPLLPIRADRR